MDDSTEDQRLPHQWVVRARHIFWGWPCMVQDGTCARSFSHGQPQVLRALSSAPAHGQSHTASRGVLWFLHGWWGLFWVARKRHLHSDLHIAKPVACCSACCRKQPNEPCSLDKLAELGVLYWKLDADKHETDPRLDAIRKVRGYSYVVSGLLALQSASFPSPHTWKDSPLPRLCATYHQPATRTHSCC